MYRTDKQFMKNPATATSRIYIGGLPKTVVAEDLEQKFNPHGKILGMSINSGFAFIQYDTENEAQGAIRAENGTAMQGRKIVVRQAFAGGPPSNKAGGSKPDMNRPPHEMNMMPEMGGTKVHEIENPIIDIQDDDEGPNIRPPPFEEPRRVGGGGGGGGGGGRIGGPPNRGRGGGNMGPMRNQMPARFEPPDNFQQENPPSRHPSGGGGGFYEDYAPPIVEHPNPPPPTDRNDCEIIVVSRALTEYAEFIESRLKQIGLIVDLLFPNDDVPIGKVLANVSSRGCLYAILVMPQNEEHRSLTLNVLHGIPQEHRNMPLDDALLLVQRNFEAYMRGDKPPDVDTGKKTLADRHPVPIQMLFNLLAENRMLSTTQYDRVLEYLKERRDLQREHESVEGGVEDKQSELQSRILNILNKTEPKPPPVSITAPASSSTAGGQEAPTPLLKDPSVQKALDSILGGELFKGIAG